MVRGSSSRTILLLLLPSVPSESSARGTSQQIVSERDRECASPVPQCWSFFLIFCQPVKRQREREVISVGTTCLGGRSNERLKAFVGWLFDTGV